jgi:NAD-dependent DNA ligase
MKAHFDILEEYLIHSYIYYNLDDNIISDGEFDLMCKGIQAGWDRIDSPYKKIVAAEESTNGFKGKDEDFPVEIRLKAKRRLEDKNAERELYASL